MAQRAQRRRQAGFVVGPRGALDQHDGGDQRDGHQGRHPEERAAPADVAEDAAQQRAEGDADAQRGFVQHDGAGEPAAGRRDDDGEGGGDEQRVADAPAGPEADDPADGAEAPAAALKTTIRTRPAISVCLAPIRLETQPVTSMATAVTTR